MLVTMACWNNTKDTPKPEALGWKLAYQSYTFKNFSFAEGLQKANDLELNYVEAYPGQRLSPDNPTPLHHQSDDATRKVIKHLLKKHRITLLNYGVVKVKKAADWKQVFEFAKDMDIQTITAEPDTSHLDYVEQLADSFQVNVAIHNHPKPSHYWHPDSVLKHIAGRSPRIGACADVGHWVRSGLDPNECLKKLKGHVISLHFKDLDKKERTAHDVPWGTGVCNVPALLQTLKDQEFKGVFSIEYEYNWDNNVPEIRESIKNFHAIAATLN